MYLILTIIFFIANIFLLYKAIKKKVKTDIINIYIILLVSICISSLATILKTILVYFKIEQVFFLEPFIYFSVYMVPISTLIIAILFIKRKSVPILRLLILYIPSVILLTLIATNDLHYLFFNTYSFNYKYITYGIAYAFAGIYIYLVYFAAVIIFIYGSYKYFNRIPKQTFMFVFLVFIYLLLAPVTSYIAADFNFYFSPLLLSGLSIFLFNTIIKYEHMSYIPLDLQRIIDIISYPILLIDNLGRILASNRAFDKTIESIYKSKEYPDDFYKIIKEISSPHYNLLKSLVQTALVKDTKITKEFNFTFKKKSHNYTLDVTTISKAKPTLIKKKNARKKHIATLLIFKSLKESKEEKTNIQEKENIIGLQSKYATLGELAAGVAHDINTPITSIKTALSILRSYDLTETEQMAIDQMDKSANRILEVSTSIRDQFRNMGLAKKEMFSFNLLVSEISSITKTQLERKNIKLYLDIDPDILLYGIPAKLSQVILNILNNSIAAYDSISEKKESIIVFKAYKGKKNVVISIEDYAGGIPKSLRPFIFKNILTTKGAKGFGLGLYICSSIIKEDFNGKITYECKDNLTRIKMSIPLITDKFTIHTTMSEMTMEQK